MSCDVYLEQCTVKAASCDIDLIEQRTVKAMSCDVDLKQYIIKALSSVSSHFRNVIMWVTCEQHKNPLLEGVGLMPVGAFAGNMSLRLYPG